MHYKNFAVNQKASIFVSYFIKEFVHGFSCAYIKLWMHLGSLKSTQEARGALSCTSSYSYASFVLSKLPACTITRYTHAKHEQILKFPMTFKPYFTDADLVRKAHYYGEFALSLRKESPAYTFSKFNLLI